MVNEDDFYLDGDLSTTVREATEATEPACNTGPVPAKWMPLFCDIETVPDEERLESFDLPPLPPIPGVTGESELPEPAELITGTAESIKTALNKLGAVPDEWLDKLVTAEATLKNRSGVLESIDKARKVKNDILKLHEERLKLLSTTPEYCQIAALGWAVGDSDIFSCVLGLTHQSEHEILSAFWKLAESHSPVIAYCGLTFDLPVILARSAMLGVQPTRTFDLRPFSKDVFDPYIGRFGSRGNTDSRKPGKLKVLAKVYGIDAPAGDVDGSRVHELMKTPEGREAVGKYVKSDVHVLREFYHRLQGYFWV